MAIPKWTVHEALIQSEAEYGNPLWDAPVEVEFTSPSGLVSRVDAFWDGDRDWRVRFCPDESGTWRWHVVKAPVDDGGLRGASGEFDCVEQESQNPLYRHGPPRVSENRRYLTHADGAPLFWLADTAWNGALRSTAPDWDGYLAARRRQAFTAVQFVSTQWRAAPRGPGGDIAYAVNDRLTVNPSWFQKLDRRVAAINAHGLVAVPVILWAYGEEDPGRSLSEEDAIRLARYIVARWHAHHVVWLLGGDGDYREEESDRWRRIGRAVFQGRHTRPVTMHPMGGHYVGREFENEEWYDFVGYQSSHTDKPERLRWMTEGPPARMWKEGRARPVINLEPNYEAHPAYGTRIPFGPFAVRRAGYWSLLTAPTAGVTYGHNQIWPWSDQPEVPAGHEGIGVVGAWHEAVPAPGAENMRVLHEFFADLPWWRLRPHPEMVAGALADDSPERFIAASATDDGSQAVVYLPVGQALELRTGGIAQPSEAAWIDPRTGNEIGAPAPIGARQEYTAPDERDWLLHIRPATRSSCS